MKITELNTTDTYRLIDKDGWVSQCSHNRIMYDKWYIILLQGFTLDEVDEGDGCIGDECVIDRSCEYKFFEKVVCTPHPMHELLLALDFEETNYTLDYQGVPVKYHFYELRHTRGTLFYEVFTSKLYIWSGVGIGCYYFSDLPSADEDNQCYGFEIYIQSKEHLEGVLVALLHNPIEQKL